MKRHRVNRRSFMKIGLIGAGGAALASCGPAVGSPTPTSHHRPRPTTVPVGAEGKIRYPAKNTKVTNPGVIFRWNPHKDASAYAVECFTLVAAADGSYGWDLAFSDCVKEAFYNTAEKNIALTRGGYYFWRATSLQSPVAMPARGAYKLPGGIKVNSKEDGQLNQAASIAYPERDPLAGELDSDAGRFFVKPEKNYLEKYLRIKQGQSDPNKPFEPHGPVIPLMFCLLDRYNRIQTGELKPAPMDEMFAGAIGKLGQVPPELADRLGGQTSLLTPERLGRAVDRFRSSDPELRKTFFGSTFADLPEESVADLWMENAARAALSQYFLGQALLAAKSISIDVKSLSNQQSLADPVRLKVIDPVLLANAQFLNPTNTYTLDLYTSDNTLVKEVSLFPMQVGDDYYLISDTILPLLDSAVFTAKLSGAALPGSPLWGAAVVTGGTPFLINVDPVSAQGTESDVKVRVRDAGNPTGCKIRLTPAGGAPLPDIDATRVEQVWDGQTFQFALGNLGTQIGAYTLSFIDSGGNPASNTLDFFIQGTLYRVRVTELLCKDESNPEWWGDDSISFSTLVNTRNFVQYPATSHTYDGFSDDTSMGYGDFEHRDGDIYFRKPLSDGDEPTYAIEGRIIEGYLAVGVGIYEHDDLGWLAWLINEVIDVVQSFLEGLLDDVTGGVGGYIVEFGLESSGLNDMREEAVNAMVSGWEVECLHEGTWQWPTQNMSLDMNGPESEYQLTFQVVQA
jgi:hypothetical protein